VSSITVSLKVLRFDFTWNALLNKYYSIVTVQTLGQSGGISKCSVD